MPITFPYIAYYILFRYNDVATQKKEAPQDPAIKPFIDVKEIAGKSSKEVAELLGQPVKSEKHNFAMGPNIADQPKRPVVLNFYKELIDPNTLRFFCADSSPDFSV